MKALATAILGCMLMGCGGQTVEQHHSILPKDQPVHFKQSVFQGEGYQLDLTGVSSWTKQDLPQENGMSSFELVNDEFSRMRVMFVQMPYTHSALEIASIIYLRFAEEGLEPTQPVTASFHGATCAQIVTNKLGLSMRTSIFATGKHADIIGCSHPYTNIVADAQQYAEICLRVVDGFHITE